MTSIQDCLVTLNSDLLKGLARKLEMTDKTLTRKAEIAQALARWLTHNLPDYVGKLSDVERLWLADSAHQGRYVPADEFQAKFGPDSPWTRKDPCSYSTYSSRHDPSLLELVIDQSDYQARKTLLTPLMEPLKAILPKPAAKQLRTVPELPVDDHKCVGSDGKVLQVFEGERIAPVEAARVLRLAQAGKLKVTDSVQRPTDPTVRVIGGALVVPDFALERPAEQKRQWGESEKAGAVRAHAWGVLVQQCGWTKAKAGALGLTLPGQDFLVGFSPEKYRRAVLKFIHNGDFDELHRVNHIKGQTGKGKGWITSPGIRKTGLLALLATLPVGQWIEFTEFHRAAVAAGSQWRVAQGSTEFLYMCDAQYGAIYDPTGVNAQFLRAVVMESLATLGLVDVAYVYPHGEGHELNDNWGADSLEFCGRYDGLRYLRLNPLGAYCLGATDRYETELEAHPKLFRVLPNLELVLTGDPVDAAHRAVLELLASPQNDRVWSLDRERMLSHVETGGSLAELKQFLTNNAADGIPNAVQVFLTELEEKLGACREASEAILLHWQDESTARLVATSSGTNKLCYHAGENRVVVAKSDYRSFARAVKKLGYVTPAH